MRVKRTIATLSAAALLLGAAPVLAQQPEKPAPGMMGGGTMGGGMMGGGMMGGGGMMDMMQGCHRMMGGGMMAHQLPPGNEKLQLQMQAEMMQKMGEILAKYAGQIKESRPGMR